MPKFIPYDYKQNTLIVINFQDQLQPGTFDKIDHFLKTEEPRLGTSKKKDEVKSNITDNAPQGLRNRHIL